MPVVQAVATAVPRHRVAQSDLRALADQVLPDRPDKTGLLTVFDNALIDGRNLAMPIEWYLAPHGFKERNDAYAEVGLALVVDAARACLANAGLRPEQVDGVVMVSTTGLATPSLEARLANAIGLRSDIARVPVWGLGCAGGVAGLARAADLARANPKGRFLVVAMELCSLSFDIGKAVGNGAGVDKKSLIAASLFADGCGAVVVCGDEATTGGLRVVAATSHLFPATERIMGWDVEDHNLEVVLSPEIPGIVRREAGGIVRRFLASHLGDGARPDHWVLHPGGAKVVEAFRDALGLADADLASTSAVLRAHGNMSSPTVLFALQHAWPRIRRGDSALLGALGPGFAGEFALLEGAR